MSGTANGAGVVVGIGACTYNGCIANSTKPFIGHATCRGCCSEVTLCINGHSTHSTELFLIRSIGVIQFIAFCVLEINPLLKTFGCMEILIGLKGDVFELCKLLSILTA